MTTCSTYPVSWTSLMFATLWFPRLSWYFFLCWAVDLESSLPNLGEEVHRLKEEFEGVKKVKEGMSTQIEELELRLSDYRCKLPYRTLRNMLLVCCAVRWGSLCGAFGHKIGTERKCGCVLGEAYVRPLPSPSQGPQLHKDEKLLEISCSGSAPPITDRSG